MEFSNKMNDLRKLIMVSDVHMYEVADRIGIAEPTLFRWLRKYDANHYQVVLKAFIELQEEKTTKGE